MTAQSLHEVTHLLHAWRRGDVAALDKLIPLVYDELPRLAHCYMACEWANNTLQTTALGMRIARCFVFEWRKE